MSNRARWKKPSGGFVAICLTYLTGALFFAWSLATPDLDRVWTLYHMLKIGGVGHLAQDDRELFGAALTRHDNLAVALLHGAEIGVVSAHDSGWIASPNVTVLRTARAGEGTKIVLDVQTPPDLFPLSIEVLGGGWQRAVSVSKQGLHPIALPAPPSKAEIIELTVSGAKTVDPSSLGIRIRFEKP